MLLIRGSMIEYSYTDYENYISSIINQELESMEFKRNYHYTGILENLTYDLGKQYLDVIIEKYDEFFQMNKTLLYELCCLNDSIGKPFKYPFLKLNNIHCSAYNFRYILHSLMILYYFKELNLSEVDIIEIGGGYGGLCFYLCNLSKCFNIKINSYSIFDLEIVSKLQKKVLDKLLIGECVNFMTLGYYEESKLKANSFLISNYAYDEIGSSFKTQYKEKIIYKYCQNGFLTYNMVFAENDDLLERAKRNEVEYPQTNFNGVNKHFYL